MSNRRVFLELLCEFLDELEEEFRAQDSKGSGFRQPARSVMRIFINMMKRIARRLLIKEVKEQECRDLEQRKALLEKENLLRQSLKEKFGARTPTDSVLPDFKPGSTTDSSLEPGT